MIKVDIKSLLLRLNPYLTTSLQAAAGLSVSRTHYEVTVEHLFVKLLEDMRSDWGLIAVACDIDTGRLRHALEAVLEEYKTGNSGKPAFSPALLELLQDAWLTSSVDLQERSIRSGGVLLAFLAKPIAYGDGAYVDMLKTINRENLLRDFWTLTKGSLEKPAPAAAPASGGDVGQGRAGDSFIARFCNDFTQKAREGKIDPVFGRDQEIRQMVDILARRRKNNPICVGEPGVGKTAVVEGLALRIVENDIPEVLRDNILLELDMGLLEAGAGMKGEFENRLRGVISEIKASEKPIVLFIDEAHTLIGAGGSAGGSDAANLLKPALARGELRTVAATTWSEYKKYFEKDPALARRFQPVKLDPPSVDDTILILRGLKEGYERSHGVIVRDDAAKAAAELADRYITGRFLPDKAIDLLDTACARVKINLTTKPPELEDLERQVQAAERSKKALERDRTNGVAIDEEALAGMIATIETATGKAEQLRQRWLQIQERACVVLELRNKMRQSEEEGGEARAAAQRELEEASAAMDALQGDTPLMHIEVSPDIVAKVVSDWTGIPLGRMLRDEAGTMLVLEERLGARIKGQDQALVTLGEVLRSAKAGIKNPNQPLGVFLFVGPSGVGKTESALALADLMFGSEKSTISINMSEFQEAHTTSRLIGSPPGYVGYGEGGMLTEAVRQKPYSVVLLDEVEKAHLDVMELFYQVFDKGTMTDGEGKEINFRNTVIILTSNLASDVIQEMTAGSADLAMDTLTGAIRPILSHHFKPALLARMTIVPFFSLGAEAMRGIVQLKLGRVRKTLWQNNKMALTFADQVIDVITARCTEVETGARNIDYILNANVLPKLSQAILHHLSEGEMPAAVHLDVDDDGTFQYHFTDEGGGEPEEGA
ncbi:type VI secretion system ATPase TssH [Desulfobulbus elongatus]|uniref:type VI secretion system ATPase TssH n=1 Tax=Desulfobulbus elongatus TaxID=53332 RepID=UPI0004833C8F|nr:type VI secretion system ATPase TssH [Desulfobulbus elongatus]